jgi:hypothetical protein
MWRVLHLLFGGSMNRIESALFVAAALGTFASSAQAASGTFACISSPADCAAISNTLTWSYVGDQYTITNSGVAGQFVQSVFFDFNPGPVAVSLIGGAGTAFATPSSPPNLPGGDAYVISGASWDSTWDANPPPSTNGINGGESAAWQFVAAGNQYQVGVHFQGLNDGKSASLVAIVPEPEAYVLAMAGMLVVGMMRRRKS